MRVLVTGISGFIGSALAPALEARGHVVSGVTREARTLAEAFAGSEAVVHLANIAHSTLNRELLWRVNVDGTRRAAELAAAAGAKRFVYLSSVKAGREEPGDAYAETKLAAERALAGVRGVEIVILRLPLVYGPRVKANFLRLMRAVARGWPLPFASIRNRRSFLYVGNLVDAIARALDAPRAAGKTYLVADGAPVSTPELCRALGAALGRPARLFPFPPGILEILPSMKKLTRSLEVDDSAFRGDAGWRPPYTFEQGIRLTAEWHRGRGG